MSQLFWSPGMTLEQAEKIIIQAALAYHAGNKEQTARSLGLATKTIYNKLEEYKEQDARTKAARDEADRRAEEQRKVDEKPIEVSLSERRQSDEAAAGLRVQSAIDAAKKYALSVPEREKVQSVPPQLAAGRNPRSNGR